MNCKKYRACLVGVIVIMLVCGLFFYMKNVSKNDAPVDATLVKNSIDTGEEAELWA